MQDGIKIPTAIGLSMFLRTNNRTARTQILSYVRVSGISKMTASNRKWIYNKFITNPNVENNQCSDSNP